MGAYIGTLEQCPQSVVYRPLEVPDALSDTHEVSISFIIILRCYLPFSLY